MATRTIKLPCFGIEVTIETDDKHKPISGVITNTNLKTDNEDEEDELYNAAMDGILSLILAHAMAEIDITSVGYIEGLETAVNACANNF